MPGSRLSSLWQDDSESNALKNKMLWVISSNNGKQDTGTRNSVFKPVHGPFLISEETLLGRLIFGLKFRPQPFRLLRPSEENVLGRLCPFSCSFLLLQSVTKNYWAVQPTWPVSDPIHTTPLTVTDPVRETSSA